MPKKWYDGLNQKIAVSGTRVFGSIWAFYAFFIWGLLGMMPFLPPYFKNFVLLVSSAWIQLWALPLLAVGNSVLNRTSEKRAKQDHETLKAQFLELKDLQKDNDIILQKLENIEQILRNKDM